MFIVERRNFRLGNSFYFWAALGKATAGPNFGDITGERQSGRSTRRSEIPAPKGAAITGTSPARLVPWNVHDLRRTIATGLQRLEVTGGRFESYQRQPRFAGVYQRHDGASEKRAALDAWAAHVRSVAEGSNVGPNVVTIRWQCAKRRPASCCACRKWSFLWVTRCSRRPKMDQVKLKANWLDFATFPKPVERRARGSYRLRTNLPGAGSE
jgi:hypothetical protein